MTEDRAAAIAGLVDEIISEADDQRAEFIAGGVEPRYHGATGGFLRRIAAALTAQASEIARLREAPERAPSISTSQSNSEPTPPVAGMMLSGSRHDEGAHPAHEEVERVIELFQGHLITPEIEREVISLIRRLSGKAA